MSTAFDVAIVGYGPVGQVLALRLGQAGLRVLVVERWPSLFQMPRAVHYDHEIARIFQACGVSEAVQAITVSPTDATYRSARHEILVSRKLTGAGPSGWPFANGFAQPELEAVLDAAVRALPNVEILRGWQAVCLSQDDEGVDLGIQSGGPGGQGWVSDGGRRDVRAKFAVGADGANSFVRRSMDTGVTDLGFAFDWLVVNVKWKPGFERDVDIMQFLDPARPTTLVPGGVGRRRWEFMLVPGETAEEMNREETAWRLLADWDVTPETAILERHAVYTFRALWADTWRDGRLLLAGDAAHLMPPFMAQGMCSGVRDAMTLSWQLPMVLAGEVPVAFLDNYGVERLEHVKRFIFGSVEQGKIICIADPVAAAARDAGMLAAMADPRLAPPMPPPPRIGAGIVMEGNDQAGLLSFQGEIEVDGRRGRFDDLLGGGFTLVGTGIDPAAHLSLESRGFLDALGAVVVQVTPDGRVRDVGGAYAAWFGGHGFGAVLSRPDFYQFAATNDPAELNAIVACLRSKLKGPGAAGPGFLRQ